MGSRSALRSLGFAFSAFAALPSSGCKRKNPPKPLAFETPALASTAPPPAPTQPAPEKLPEPASGKAHVRGRVTFGGVPLEGTDVELCTAGCAQTIWAKTDANGDYVFRDIAAGTYGYLGIRLFDSDSFHAIWPNANKRDIAAGKVVTENASLVKTDLALVYPRAAARTSATPTFKWSPYPDAAEYVITIERAPGETPFSAAVKEKHVKATSFTLDAPLAPGRWQIGLSVYKAPSVRVADLPSRVVFIVPSPDDTEPPSMAGAPAEAPQVKRLPSFELAKPEPGFGAVQGLVVVGDEPAAGVEVKLCEGFSERGGCSGKILKTKTDERGIYLFAKVAPHTYKGLTAKVFDTREVIFAGRKSYGVTTPQAFAVAADRVVKPATIYLFRSDLRVSAPASKVTTAHPELAWVSYPNAAYYALTLSRKVPDTVEFAFLDFRVDEPRFVVDRPLTSGDYSLTVTAYNAAGRRLANNDKKPKTFSVR